MMPDYKMWREQTDSEWMFDQCKNIGKYMLVPIAQDDDGTILHAHNRRCKSSTSAIQLLKNIKALYKIHVVTIYPDMVENPRNPFTHRRTRGYLIRGVW